MVGSRVVVVCGVGVMALATPSVALTGAGVAASTAVSGEGPDQPWVEARRTGEPVELVERREEATSFFANPDGSTTAEVSASPSRVEQGDGSWVDIDLTVVKRSDGSVGPKVSSDPVSFSGGGSGPAVTVEHAGHELALTMPMVLPVPVLEGRTATYADVYPGVDLRLEAVGSSFQQLLVVKDRQAASNPDLASIEMRAKVSGGGELEVVDDALVVLDDEGEVALSGIPASMWDASVEQGQAADVPELSTSQNVGDVGVAVRDSTGGQVVTLSPSTEVLMGQETTYPVVIDPTVTRDAFSWAMVNKTFPSQQYYKWSSQDEGVGFNSYEGTHGKRIYWSFTIPTAVKGDGVRLDATTLDMWSTFTASCSPGSVQVYRTGSFDSSTTWNSRPSVVGSALSSYSTKTGPGCLPDGGQGGRAEMRVGSGLRAAIDGGHDRLNLGVISTDESSNDGWFRFAGPDNDTSWKRPKLVITYNTAPLTPPIAGGGFSIKGQSCPTLESSTQVWVHPDSAGTSKAGVSLLDVDFGDQVRAEFEWWDAYPAGQSTYEARGWYPTYPGYVARDSVASEPVPTGLSEGKHYYRVRVHDDQGAASDWSRACAFYVDTTVPDPPSVSVVGHDDGDLVGIDSSQTFRAYTPDSSVHKIEHEWRVDGKPYSSGTLSYDGTSLSYPKSMNGYKVEFRARALDQLHSSAWSPWVSLHSAVNGLTSQYWMSPNGSGVVPDGVEGAPILWDGESVESEYSFPLTLSGGAAATGNQTGPARGAGAGALTPVLRADGTSSIYGLADPTPVLPDTAQAAQTNTGGVLVDGYADRIPGFTASAWVKLDTSGISRTFVAQMSDASTGATAPMTFDLGYDHTTDRFVGRVWDTQGNVYTVSDAADAGAGRTGKWWNVALSYRASTATWQPSLRLDVVEESATPIVATVPISLTTNTAPESLRLAGGPLKISHASTQRSPWKGPIDDVRTWQGRATTTQVMDAAKASN